MASIVLGNDPVMTGQPLPHLMSSTAHDMDIYHCSLAVNKAYTEANLCRLAQEHNAPGRIVLQSDQHQHIVALHKEALHRHHDLFCLLQDPSTRTVLRALAHMGESAMNLWLCGIDTFLKFLYARLSECLSSRCKFSGHSRVK